VPEAGEVHARSEGELAGTRWLLVQLGEETLVAGEEDAAAAPYLELDVDAARVSGSGGCNRLSGSIELDEAGGLVIGAIATTRMACADQVMARERRFLAALEATRSYRVEEAVLELSDETGVLARFVAETPAG
jgi:heat shock protein HslJ